MQLTEIKSHYKEQVFLRGIAYDPKDQTVWIMLNTGNVVQLDAYHLDNIPRLCPPSQRVSSLLILVTVLAFILAVSLFSEVIVHVQ